MVGKAQVLFCLLIAVVSCRADEDDDNEEGRCFNFPGGPAYVEFSPDGFNNDENIHYRLKFRTLNDNGVIMYNRGFHRDYEALYVRGGKLHYLLFNTSPSGVEGYQGAYFVSQESVNTGDWVTVNLYRSRIMHSSRRDRTRYRTGFTVKVGRRGRRATYADNRQRPGVSLSGTVSIGGYRKPLSEEVGNFVGYIKDIREFQNDIVFDEPSLNMNGTVTGICPEGPIN